MMKEQHRASCPAMFLLLYEKEGKRRGRFLPHPIRASRRGASGRRNKAFQAVGHHVSAGEGPSYLTDVVPPNEETRVCDVLPVNRTMKKYKIYVTGNFNFLLADF